MLTLIYLKDSFFKLSPRALSLFNYIVYRGSLSANLPPTLGGVAKWVGVHRTTISGELRELIDNGCLEKVNVRVDEDVVELRLLVNGSELEHLELTHAHDDTLDPLVTNMYSAMSISSRGQRLSPVNTLLLMLLLAYADQEGYIDKLSQTVMKKRLGFTDAQLKSQLAKLKKLGVLQTIVPGGAFHSISGRVKSKLRLDLELLARIARSTTSVGQKFSTAASFNATIISLETCRYIPDLFETNLQEKKRRCRATHPLEPMKIYSQVIYTFISKNKSQRYRYYRYLVELCTSYAMIGVTKVAPHLTALRKLPYGQLAAAVDDDPELSGFDKDIADYLQRDLNLDRVTQLASTTEASEPKSSEHEDGQKDNEPRIEDELEKQKTAFIETLRKLTWAILMDPALVPYLEQTKQSGHKLQLKLYNLEMGDFIVISKNLNESQ